MTLRILTVICGLMISDVGVAQEYGVVAGVHQTSASVDTAASVPAGSVSGRLGYDVGVLASFELIPDFRFRTGLLYDLRPFDYKVTGVGTFGYNLAYLDIPVNAQYNFNKTVGIFGGLIVGIKASDSVSAPAGLPTTSPNMKSMYPLVNVGANFIFNDMIGFDVYYEMGLGEFADNAKNYSTFGLHFIYWL